MSNQQPPEDFSNLPHRREDAPRLGPQDRRAPDGNGTPEAIRAAQYGVDPYAGGYGFLGAKNRFQETSALMARLHRYELTLRKHWWILAAALCVSLGPAAYHVEMTPASYQSTGKLWMSGKLDIKEGQLYSEELATFIGTQVELLKSSSIYYMALSNTLASNPAWSALMTNVSPDEPGPFKVTVTDFPKTAVIAVKAVGKERAAVRAFVNCLMEEYQMFRKGVRNEKSTNTLTSIREDVALANQEVTNRNERLQNFLSSNNVVLLEAQGSSAGTYAAKLNTKLASLRTQLAFLERITPEQLAQTAGKSHTDSDDESSLSQGIASDLNSTMAGPLAAFFQASQQIQLLRAKREQLLEFLKPSHPKILKLDQNIADQEGIVEVVKNQSLTQMADTRAALALQITNLVTSVAEWEKKALDTGRTMAENERLKQDVKRAVDNYESLLSVIRTVDVNRTLDQENMSIMDAASKPRPVRRTAIFLGLGLAAGLFLGLGLLYVVSLFDDRFASLTELGSHVPETVIGQIPDVHVPRGEPGLALVRPDDDRHAFAEAFRNMRSWILFSCDKSKQPRLILITSSVPLEGKSTVSSNLAATLAISGSRVLLIDGDLRRAGLDKIFDVPGDSGFADILEQRAPAEDVIRPTKIPNLSLLPAGSANANPGELFLGPSCDIFLARIRSQFDYVIFDTAPVLAADDTGNLAPKMNAVLFVVRADYTSARNAREALDQLRQRNATILGLVFNRSIATRAGGYYYRYNNYYYYGRNGQKRQRTKGKGTASTRGAVAAPQENDKRA